MMAPKPALAALALGGAAILVASCADIASIPAGQCGNSVVDAAVEDCDLGSRFDGQSACRPPGAEGECRYDCSIGEDGIAAPCPAGYGCGADAICRIPSGEVSREGEADDGAGLLVASDLDADGFTDLVARTSDGAVALYMGEEFEVDLDVDLAAIGSRATFEATELTGDTFGDLAFTDISGVGVLRGSEGRELVGTAYTTFTIPTAVGGALTFSLDAVDSEPGVEPLVLLQAEMGPAKASFVFMVNTIDLAPDQLTLLTPGWYPLPSLLGDSGPNVREIPFGNIDPSTPCQDYVLAFRSTDQVWIATPCTELGEANGCPYDPSPQFLYPPVPIAPIPVDLSACGPDFSVDRAFVVDVDKDGNDDVVITPEPGAVERAACVVMGPVSFPAPVFEPSPDDCPYVEGALGPAVAAAPFEDVTVFGAQTDAEYILALLHLDDDDVIDIVSTLGIFVSRPGECPTLRRPNQSPTSVQCFVTPGSVDIQKPYFTSVGTGDINGDGVEDVAMVGSSGSLAVYLANPSDTYAAFPVETDGIADLASVADIDGDGIQDVVFADRPCSDDGCGSLDPENGDALMVAYGRAGGGPEAPRNAGRLGRIQRIVTGRFRSPYATFDGTVDVGVLSAALDDQQVQTFATLYGSTGRQLQAPFGLNAQGAEPGEFIPYLPLLVAAGELVAPVEGKYGPAAAPSPGQSSAPDLAILAVERAEGKLELPDLSPDALGLWILATEGEAEVAFSSVTADLPLWDPELDLGALSFLSGDIDGDGGAEVVVLGGRGFSVGKVTMMPSGQPGFVTTPVSTAERFAARLLRLGSGSEDTKDPLSNPATLADVDGDSLADLVAIGTAADGSHVLVTYFSTGGSFDADDKSVVPLAGRPHALVVLDIDGDLAPEILVAGAEGVTLRRIVDHVFSAPVPLPGWVPSADPPRAIAVGDFDGDGVRDLAFGSESATTFYRVLPRIE